ncbi:hypothetical protein NDU88_000305 [Pleurodeles waltl]|uniref:Uncharacterized protein n=1 Tax=Pleurodeles waltl TaxID=8319 RepID=A0AAV7KPK7_PLEWA|nr:hypothetical protein NDU88_000305 [Pleurodeles waltl]
MPPAERGFKKRAAEGVRFCFPSGSAGCIPNGAGKPVFILALEVSDFGALLAGAAVVYSIASGYTLVYFALAVPSLPTYLAASLDVFEALNLVEKMYNFQNVVLSLLYFITEVAYSASCQKRRFCRPHLYLRSVRRHTKRSLSALHFSRVENQLIEHITA